MNVPRLNVPLTASGLDGVKYLQTVLAVGSVLVFLTIIWLGYEVQNVEDQIADLETAVVQTHNAYRKFRRQSDTEGIDLSPTRLQALPQEVTLANQVMQHQKFSWTQLLNDLERTTPPQISMESIVLNNRKSSLALSGAALTLQDLLALVDKLKDHPAFHRVEIASHQVQRRPKNIRTGPVTFIGFSLDVSYEPSLHVP